MPPVVPESPPYAHRLLALRESLGPSGVDALLVTHPPNVRYLAGFNGSVAALLVAPHATVLIVDGRYVTAARALVESTSELREVSVELAETTYEPVIARLATTEQGIYNLGVEADAITLSRFDRLSEALGRAEAGRGGNASAPRLRSTEHLVERGRVVKDDWEIANLREAAARLSRVARVAPSFVRPGRTEREIAGDIDSALHGAGFERPAFETIVASGPNSALPHARPGSRTVEPGDGVVLDFGGVYDGYCVDLTRTVQLAPVTESFGRLFEAVCAAHAAAIAAVRPGIPASAVDEAARRELDRHGLADAFLHGTGHGLGLEVHEAPRVTKARPDQPDETLRQGMVFTVEPGAYVAHLGGVRIEDDVLVVEGGCEVLTDVPIERTAPAGRGARA